MAEPTEHGFGWNALAAVVAPFVVAGILAAVAFDDDYDIGLALWQAVVLWPIGGILLAGPVAIAGNLRNRKLYVRTLVAIAAAGAASVTLVGSSDDAQAGIGFIYAPFVGCCVAGVAIGLDRLISRRVP